MSSRLLRALLVIPVVTLVAIASCGSDDQKVVEHGSAGDAGANETGGQGFALAGSPSGGTSTPGGADTAAGASGAGVGGDGRTFNPQGGASGADTGGAAATDLAGAGAGGGAGGGAGDSGIDPIVDVGVGCNPPPALPRPSPTAAGLPKDGLVLWLRGDRGVYATDSQRVCAWADQSGHQYLFLATGQARPLWGATLLGAEPAIHFDATTNYLSVGGVLGIAPTSARTFIAVIQLVSTTQRFSAIMQGVGNSAGTYMNLDANTFSTAGSREGAYLTNNAYDTPLATSATPRVHVLTASTLAPGTTILSALDYRVDGATQTLTRTPGGLGSGKIEDFSAANFTLVGLGASAIMAEALVYDRVLSTDERAAVETALKARYGIQ
jgi:hypothetical protein